LDSAFKQTGNSFTGKIKNDDGAFKIESVDLASQYALLKAEGYYRNEVTGKKSNGTISLYAITDLSDREKVNVNLLTHLEYERAMYLVKHDTLTVAEAKKQAESEIFDAFGMWMKFDNSEDLNILSSSEGGSALLAISVLMQADRSEAELTEFLTKFASDIEEDGVWDDEKAKEKTANWAMKAQAKGIIDSVQNNVLAWGLVDTISDYYAFLIERYWKEFYEVKDCEIGEAYKITKVSSGDYIMCGAHGWVIPTDIEVALGACYDEIEKDTAKHLVKHDGVMYACLNNEWVSDTAVVDTLGFGAGKDGEVKKGIVSGVSYVYDEGMLQAWRKATDNEIWVESGCTYNKNGVVETSKNDVRLICDYSKGDWRLPTDIEVDTYKLPCTKDSVGVVIKGLVYESNKYGCTSDGWLSLFEKMSWEIPVHEYMDDSRNYDTIVDARDEHVYRVVTIGSQRWMAENLNYDYNKGSAKSFCADDSEDKCKVSGRYYTWAALIDSAGIAADKGDPQTCGDGVTCERASAETIATKPLRGVCPEGWHVPSKAEWGVLIEYIADGEGKSKVVLSLKSRKGWGLGDGYDSSVHTWGYNGIESRGFSLLPTGLIGTDGKLAGFGSVASLWAADDWTESDALFYNIHENEGDRPLNVAIGSKNTPQSVRCIQDR